MCEVIFGKTPLLKSNSFAREIIAAFSSQDTPRGGTVCVSHRPLFLYRLLRSVSCLSRTIPSLVLAHTTNLYTESGIRRLQNALYLVGVTDGARTRYLQSDSLMCLPLPLQPQICLDLVSETMVTEVILLTFPPHCLVCE